MKAAHCTSLGKEISTQLPSPRRERAKQGGEPSGSSLVEDQGALCLAESVTGLVVPREAQSPGWGTAK